jgi:hypothetical protein
MLNIIKIMTASSQKILITGLICGGAFLPASSFAAKIADTPWLTSLQSTTGAAIQAVCGGLASTNKITSTPLSAEADLFNQCNAMVHTSNAIQNDS